MKTYLANETSNINYLAVDYNGKWLYFKTKPSGIFTSEITALNDAFEQFSVDEKIDFLKATCRLLSFLEEENFNLDDLKIAVDKFNVPEWLILDDYRNNDVDMILHTTTGGRIDFYYQDGKQIAISENSSEAETIEARKFIQRLDEYYQNQNIDDDFDDDE